MDTGSKRQELLRKKIRTRENGEQTIELAEQEISRLCEELDLSSSIGQVASAIYRRSLEHKFIENRTIGMVAAGSVYTASRVEKDVRTSEEVSEVARGNIENTSAETILQRAYSEINTALELNTGPIDPEDHVERLVEDLDVSDLTRDKVGSILHHIDGEFLSGKSPISVAASAIYLAALLSAGDDPAQRRLTQEEVAEASGVTVATISNTYTDILGEISDEI